MKEIFRYAHTVWLQIVSTVRQFLGRYQEDTEKREEEEPVEEFVRETDGQSVSEVQSSVVALGEDGPGREEGTTESKLNVEDEIQRIKESIEKRWNECIQELSRSMVESAKVIKAWSVANRDLMYQLGLMKKKVPRRVVHLARHHKKARVRKKNQSRMRKSEWRFR